MDDGEKLMGSIKAELEKAMEEAAPGTDYIISVSIVTSPKDGQKVQTKAFQVTNTSPSKTSFAVVRSLISGLVNMAKRMAADLAPIQPDAPAQHGKGKDEFGTMFG
jgi:hypothetical protein